MVYVIYLAILIYYLYDHHLLNHIVTIIIQNQHQIYVLII